MHPLHQQLLQISASMPDEAIAAITAHMQFLADELDAIATTVRLREPADEGAELLAAASEYLGALAGLTHRYPSLTREVAAQQLRGVMHVAGTEPERPASGPEAESVWKMLGLLAREAAGGIRNKRDRRSLERVYAIAMQQVAKASAGKRPRTQRLTLVKAPNSGE